MKFAFPSPAKSLVVIILLSVLLVAVSAKLYVTRNFILSFNAEATKDLTYQAYYAKKASQSFTEQNSVKQQVKAGKSKVEIILPIHKIAKLRMDLGNNPEKLVISNLKLNGMKEIKFNDFNKFDYINIEKKEIFPDTLTIKANHKYPSIIYNEKLSAKGRIIIDWHIFIILSAFYFFVSWKLVKYLAKFKIEKNHSRIDIVFLAFFFALLFVPMSHISDAEKSEQENRALAAKPLLKDVYGGGCNYGEKFEKWFNDRFFGRDFLVSLNSHIQNKLSTKGNEKVLIGKDGWLFYKGDNSLRNFQNLDLFTEKDLRQIAKYLSDIDSWAKKNGKDFYYLICPDKNKIYGENMLYLSPANPDEKSRANQLIKYLRENTNVKVIYPYEALHKAKKDGILYWKNDTHWNELGAYTGYLELMSEITKKHKLPIVKYKKLKMLQHLKGDLTAMMKGIKEEPASYPAPVFADNAKCDTDLDIPEKRTCINKKLNKNLLIYRDSFTGALQPYLNNTFGKVSYLWRYEVSKNDFSKLQEADIIILEQVERYIPQISDFSFFKD